ncbi:hypothetical protein SESBI_04906 [Sesbania bispinosa]|nr:hypothetical protein SESBI_04906 [Sesbania bispinosa]
MAMETQEETIVMETPPSQIADEGPKDKPLFETDTSMRLRRKVVSYKDIILGVNGDSEDNSESDNSEEEEGSEEDAISSSEEEDEHSSIQGDPFCPDVSISHEEHRNACKQWKNSVIIKVLGKRVGRAFLFLRLTKLWSLRDELRRVAVWIRVPGLPMEFYDKTILWRIGNTIGKTVRVDANTLKPREGTWGQTTTERGKFARLCIEIDLQKNLISQFRLSGRSYNVEYEGLHIVYFNCGRYGHGKDACPLKASENDKDQQPKDSAGQVENGMNHNQTDMASTIRLEDAQAKDTFGPWMLVQRPVRKRHPANKKAAPTNVFSDAAGNVPPTTNDTSGSRFRALFSNEIDKGKELAANETTHTIVETPSETILAKPQAAEPNSHGPKSSSQAKILTRSTPSHKPSSSQPKQIPPQPQPSFVVNPPVNITHKESSDMELDTHLDPTLAQKPPHSTPSFTQKDVSSGGSLPFGDGLASGRPPDPTSKPLIPSGASPSQRLETKDDDVIMDVGPTIMEPGS